MTKLSRRNFLVLAAAADAALLIKTSGAEAKGVGDYPLHKKVGETTSICPYCSCGCGVLVATNEEGHITNVEGDPDHPTNRGRLDPKSLALQQMSTSPLRLKTVMYRAPNTDKWEVRTWDWAVEQIAERIIRCGGRVHQGFVPSDCHSALRGLDAARASSRPHRPVDPPKC